MAKTQIHNVVALLKANVSVLVYNGANDYMCNWIGGKAWTQAAAREHQGLFGKKAFKKWTGSEGEVGGLLRNYGKFSFLIFNGAGHMVQEKQPANGVKMMRDFIEYGAQLDLGIQGKTLKE